MATRRTELSPIATGCDIIFRIMTSKTQIFISYAREQQAIKQRLYTGLNRKLDTSKFNIWDDSRIPIGRYEEIIKRQIQSSSIYILLLSSDFEKSEFIKKEIQWMLEEISHDATKIIVPIVIKDFTKETASRAFQNVADYQFYPKQQQSLENDKNPDVAWVELLAELSLDISRNKNTNNPATPNRQSKIVANCFGFIFIFTFCLAAFWIGKGFVEMNREFSRKPRSGVNPFDTPTEVSTLPIDTDDVKIYSNIDVEQQALFPGCRNSQLCNESKMHQYLKANLTLPQHHISEGIIKIQFVVEKDGHISNVNTLSKKQSECSQQAIKALLKMNELETRWSPAVRKGKRVRSLLTHEVWCR